MYIVLWMVDFFIWLFSLCAKVVVKIFQWIFETIAVKKEVERQVEAAGKPYEFNGLYAKQNADAEPVQANEISTPAVEINTAESVQTPVKEAPTTLKGQIEALRTIVEDVKPIRQLEADVYQQCLISMDFANQRHTTWTNFSLPILVPSMIATVIAFAAALLTYLIIGVIAGAVEAGIFLAMGCWIVVLVSLLIKFKAQINAKEDEELENEYLNKLGQCKAQAMEILKNASNKCGVLHPIYCYPQALYSIVQYCETGRATDIKEAINIFENELKSLSQEEHNRMLLYFELKEDLV